MRKLGKRLFIGLAFAIGLVLAVGFSLAVATPVSAGGGITIDIGPDSGSVGTEVYVSGGGATQLGDVDIYWNDDDTLDGGETFLGLTFADWYGDYPIIYITVPEDIDPGEYFIIAYDVSTGNTRSASFVVTTENNPPTAPVVDVTPDRPSTTDDLVCTITTPSTDPDGDTITYTYEWYKNGVPQPTLTTNTVPAANTAAGQVWKCVVTPNDGIEDGPSAYDEVTINRPPTAPVVDVTPNSPVTTDPLVCTIITPSTDLDGDTITYTYRWFKKDTPEAEDWIPQTALTTSTVPAANTAVGQVWRYVVTPNDGIENGPSGYDQVAIGNSPPTAPVVDVTPNFPVTANDLTCSIITPSTDADDDPITYTYRWFKKDTPEAEDWIPQTALTTNTVPAASTAKDQVWRCVVTPNDGSVNGPSAYDDVTIQNSPPTAPVVDVTPNFPITTDDLVCTIITPSTDPDPGDTITYTYEWYKDGVVQGGLTTNTVPAANTAVGEVWRCEVTPNDGTVDGPSAYDEVTIQNRLPTAPVVDVTPNFPVTANDLTCSIITPSTDADDDPITYTYRWFKKDTPEAEDWIPQTALTTNTVPAASTAKGQVWRCVVTPNDGSVNGPSAYDEVTVQNRLPTAPVVDVTPNFPVTTDDLSCTIITPSTDADDDTITYTYEWYKDGVVQGGLTTSTVPAANTAKGEVWRCVITPYDGTVDGPSAYDEVTVQNKPPTAPVVDVTPDFPLITDDLVCTFTSASTDPDPGDTITYTYQWYKDGVVQGDLTTDTVPAANTAAGEVWRCVVTPYDGEDYGPPGEDQVTIQNRPPTAPMVDVTPDFPVTTNDLVCTIITPSTDPDFDPITYTYEWYKDGVLQGGLTTSTVPAANTAKGEVWRCVVTPNDGTVDGPSSYDEVTIQNKPPYAPVVDVTPDFPIDTEDLVCSIEIPSTDLDGDTITYTYQWYKDEDLQSALTTNTVLAVNTAVGEVWRCVVTPYDGFVFGASGYDEVTIQ